MNRAPRRPSPPEKSKSRSAQAKLRVQQAAASRYANTNTDANVNAEGESDSRRQPWDTAPSPTATKNKQSPSLIAPLESRAALAASGTADNPIRVETSSDDDEKHTWLPTPSRERSRSFGGAISETSGADDAKNDTKPPRWCAPTTTTTTTATIKRRRPPSPIIPSKRRLASPLPPPLNARAVALVPRASAPLNTESFGAVLMHDIRLLRAFRKDPAAMFRSMDQYVVYRNILERRCHTLHVTRTGGGKTLPLQLAMKQWPASAKAIVMVPYVVLYDELKCRFDGVDLPAQICATGDALDSAKRVYIVGINTFSMTDMYTKFCHLAQQGQVGAVLIDEADGLIADSWRPHYEWAYKYVLKLSKTVLVFASATIPRPHERKWLHTLDIEDAIYPRSTELDSRVPPFQVVRHRATDRLNIRYETLEYNAANGDSKTSELRKILEEFASKPEQTIIFATTPAFTKTIGEWLKEKRIICGSTSTADRVSFIRDFAADRGGLLIGNKAAYYGIDVPEVRQVVFVVEFDHHAPDMLEFVQAAGRAGRDGRPATCTVLYPGKHPKKTTHHSWLKPRAGQFTGEAEFVNMIKGRGCLRATMSAHLDGWSGMTCQNMSAVLNSVCHQEAFVTHCSRCAVDYERPHALMPLPPPPSLPTAWDEMNRKFKNWEDWVPGLASPAPDQRVPFVVWGARRLPETTPEMQKLVQRFQIGKGRRVTAMFTVARILRALDPSCVVCLDAGDSPTQCQHPSTNCTRSEWPRDSLCSRHAQTKKKIDHDCWKECWADYLKKQNIHGVCWRCMLPEDAEYHAINRCLYRELTTSVLWMYRDREAYREEVCLKTNGAVATLDQFDAFMFGLTNPNERGVLNGTNIVLREWYHSRLVMQLGWPEMETSTNINQAWRDAAAAFQP